MACNCNEGNRYNIGMGCCVPVLAPIENYYTKSQVDKLIEDINVSGVTEEEVDEKIASAKTEIENEIPTVPTSNTAFTNDAGYLTEHQSLSAYSTTQEVNNLINQSVSGKASQSDLETVSGDVNTLNSDAVTGIRITTVSAQKEVHIEQARLNDGYSNAGIIYTVGSGLTFDVTNKKIAVDSSVIAQKSDLSNYYNKTEVDNKVSQSTSGLQQTLSAGTNISISNNVISATDTTYSAGDGIQISGNTISTTTKFQCLTEQEWASVSGNPDTNTVYFIR